MSDLLFLLFCVPFTAADYALTSVGDKHSIHHNARDINQGLAVWFTVVFLCPVSHHRHHPRQHLHPRPDVPGQVKGQQTNLLHFVVFVFTDFLLLCSQSSQSLSG